MTAGEAAQRLAALYWNVRFDWDEGAVRGRIRAAADALGLELAQSEQPAPIHWGGRQLRLRGAGAKGTAMSPDEIAAGFGFELGEIEVLYKCREDLIGARSEPADPDTVVHISGAHLRLLAFPFSERHLRQP